MDETKKKGVKLPKVPALPGESEADRKRRVEREKKQRQRATKQGPEEAAAWAFLGSIERQIGVAIIQTLDAHANDDPRKEVYMRLKVAQQTVQMLMDLRSRNVVRKNLPLAGRMLWHALRHMEEHERRTSLTFDRVIARLERRVVLAAKRVRSWGDYTPEPWLEDAERRRINWMWMRQAPLDAEKMPEAHVDFFSKMYDGADALTTEECRAALNMDGEMLTLDDVSSTMSALTTEAANDLPSDPSTTPNAT